LPQSSAVTANQWTVAAIHPASDAVWHEEQASTLTRYFSAVDVLWQQPSLPHSQSHSPMLWLQQKVHVGDVCAFVVPTGLRQDPFLDQSWMVGQVLVLASRASLTHSARLHALVRWLPHAKQVETWMPLPVYKRWTTTYRPAQLLLETLQCQTIALAHLLPATVRIRPTQHFTTQTALPPEPFPDMPFWRLYFHVPKRWYRPDEPHRNHHELPSERVGPQWSHPHTELTLARAWTAAVAEGILPPELHRRLTNVRCPNQHPTPAWLATVHDHQPPTNRKSDAPSTDTVETTTETTSRKKARPSPSPTVSTTDPALAVQPASKIVHRATRDGVTRAFGTALRIPLQPSDTHRSVLANAQTCIVRVGDAVVMACDDARTPLRDAGPRPWYPWTRPWSVAIVLAAVDTHDEYQFQVRWLANARELPPGVLTKASHSIRADWKRPEHVPYLLAVTDAVDTVPAEAVLGRVAWVPCPPPRPRYVLRGVPQIQRVAKYRLDRHRLRYIEVGTAQSLRQTLVTRAWQLPESFIHQDAQLRQIYRTQLGLSEDADEDLSDPQDTVQAETDAALADPATKGPLAWLNPVTNVRSVPNRPLLARTNNFEFFEVVSVAVVPRFCDRKVTAKKTTETRWNVRIGDVVCLADSDSTPPPPPSPQANKARWYPFVGPWRYAQVLSIYRVPGADDSKFRLEIRWLFRTTELPLHVRARIPVVTDSAREVVWETDSVQSDVPAARVLGRAKVFLGHHVDAWMGTGTEIDSVPLVAARCSYLYFSTSERFQPLFCSGTTTIQWFQRLMERGFYFSDMIRKNQRLGSAIEFCLNISVCGGENGSGTHDLFEDLVARKEDSVDKADHEVLLQSSEPKGGLRHFVSVSIVPPWTSFLHSDVVCRERDRRGLEWTLRVGDVVAVASEKCESRCLGSFAVSDPFTSPWRICQILSLFQDANSRDLSYFAQVRWFYRDDEISKESSGISTPQCLDVVYESRDVHDEPIGLSNCLGPVSLLSSWSATITSPPYLPLVRAVYGGEYCSKMGKLMGRSTGSILKFASVVERGLSLSTYYSQTQKAEIMQAIKSHVRIRTGRASDSLVPRQTVEEGNLNDYPGLPSAIVSPPAQPSRNESFAFTSQPPFFVDSKEGVEFFTSMDIKPCLSNFAVSSEKGVAAQDKTWSVNIGDPVLLSYDARMCAGKTTFGVESGSLSTQPFFPMNVPWSVGEIVLIWRPPNNPSSEKVGAHETANDLKIEVRWFYRSAELPGGTRNQLGYSDIECEEIVETDHCDSTINASSVLSPVVLHSKSSPVSQPRFLHGVPVLEFFCRRFWSIHRRGLVPSGGSAARLLRSRRHSSFFSSNQLLKIAFEKIQSKSEHHIYAPICSLRERSVWKAAFFRVINKLSLTDASKEASQDSLALVGREKEKEQITSFLEAAIAGKGENIKPSIFIAGSPGVGKTACVRAMVSSLQVRASKGLLPVFHFVALNGMELRHPLEAYVKLWEELSGCKAKCSAETAASRLEAYFTSNEHGCQNSEEDNQVVVLLLDEIDYLVTKKQTVLYNFFDWPLRALESRSARRLIVLGVSNTLNLPERLHPRVQSRIGSRRCYFKSYDDKETVAILKAKVKQASPTYAVFEEDAIVFAAKKTAALSGDIRKAFHICRAAAETILRDSENDDNTVVAPIVRIKDVVKVSRESFNSAQSKAISHCSSLEVLFLVTVASLYKTTGREHGGFDIEEILTKMEGISNSMGKVEYLPAPSLFETLKISQRLAEGYLISVQAPRLSSVSYRASAAGSGGTWPLVSGLLDDVAIMLALKGSEHQELTHKYLAINSFVGRQIGLAPAQQRNRRLA
jgi:origin recognition complex subunit 1